jgi:L-alanine-DL-glutamate epimerase-like enolase superfamily enzyme
MILKSIQPFSLSIPFKAAFKHASAERAATQTLLVKAHSREDIVGYGEGCPRAYVTGETIESAHAFVLLHQKDLLENIQDIATLNEWVGRHRKDIDANPSAWAALELAFLDLMGKTEHKSVEALLGLRGISGKFRYTAVLGDAPRHQFEAQLAHYLKAGFKDFKIKLSGDCKRDFDKVEALTRMNISPKSVRADANNLWKDSGAAINQLQLLGYSFFALEEPLPPGDYYGMLRIATEIPTKIILDESLLREEQFAQLISTADQWIINLRVSKMGGLLRSLEVVRKARELGMRINIGAHVGETSILTRAALTVASNAQDILVGQEGAFGTYLLAYDVTDMPIMFGAGGLLDASTLDADAAGFGVNISETVLESNVSNIRSS